MILLELSPNELFRVNDQYIYSFFNKNDNGTIRVRRLALQTKEGKWFVLPALELLNMSQFTEVFKLC